MTSPQQFIPRTAACVNWRRRLFTVIIQAFVHAATHQQRQTTTSRSTDVIDSAMTHCSCSCCRPSPCSCHTQSLVWLADGDSSVESVGRLYQAVDALVKVTRRSSVWWSCRGLLQDGWWHSTAAAVSSVDSWRMYSRGHVVWSWSQSPSGKESRSWRLPCPARWKRMPGSRTSPTTEDLRGRTCRSCVHAGTADRQTHPAPCQSCPTTVLFGVHTEQFMFWYDETCRRPTAAWMRPPADEQCVCRLSVRALPRKRFVPAAYQKVQFLGTIFQAGPSLLTLCLWVTVVVSPSSVLSSVSSSQLL